MTASPGFTYTNDVLGNRTVMTPSSGTAGTYTWDCLNRMIATTASSPGNVSSTASVSYEYRADGMRVEKIDHTGVYALGGGELNDAYARYRHDGQMPMQTAIVKSDGSTLRIDNGLGARGMDWTSVTTSSGTTTSFPVYDAHGNEVATLSRGSSNTYSLANQRSYGAWGEIRQGSATGGPRGRYCGNLGHIQDDESGLVYMRARYYEPTSGRFLSEDPSMHGKNWYAYASSNPINLLDPSGREGFAGELIEKLFSQFLAYCKSQGIEVPKCVEAVEIILKAVCDIATYLAGSTALDSISGFSMSAAGAFASGAATLFSGGFLILAGVCALGSVVCKVEILFTLFNSALELEILALNDPTLND